MSPIDPIKCFTFDTFLLKICCFAKLNMNRKKRSKYKNRLCCKFCSTVWNVTMSHKAIPVQCFGRSGKKKMALGLWSDFWFCFEDIFPGISIQAFPVIYFYVDSDSVNLLLLTSCKKLDSVHVVSLFFSFFESSHNRSASVWSLFVNKSSPFRAK